MTSERFIDYHFRQFLNAWHDGILNRVRVEDIDFRLGNCQSEEEVAAIYCIINDLDDDMVPGLVKYYRDHAAKHPREIHSNIQLGEN